MTLLAPAWLAVLALGVGILLLHARRRRRVEVPSLFIWRLIDASASRRQTMRWPPPNLLLALQLLAVALAAFALAQPRFGSPADDPEHTIYVIDASGSMRTADGSTDRFTVARDYLIARAAADAGRVSVVAAAAASDIVVARQTEPSGLLPAVRPLVAGDGAADWTGAVRWIGAASLPGERTRIIVLTDGSDDGDAAIAEAFPNATLERVLFGDPGTANAGISASLTPVDGEPGRWRIVGEVVSAGTAVSEVSVRFEPEGTEGFLEWSTIALAGGDATAAGEPLAPVVHEFAVALDLPGGGRLVAAIADDAGPHDNTVRFVVPDPSRMVRVLLLGVEDPDLVRAFRAAGTVELLAADSLPADVSDIDLVVVNDATVDGTVATNVLWLARAGAAGGAEPAVLAGATSITAWSDDHPLSAGVDWRAIEPGIAYAASRLAGADVLAEAGGFPLVQARTTPAGREIRIALDLASSAWPAEPGFPLFIANLVAWLGVPPTLEASACTAGVPCAHEARLAGGRLSGETGSVLPEAVAGADWLPTGADAVFTPARAGFLRIEHHGLAADIAVNAGVSETVVARAAEAEGAPPASRRAAFAVWIALIAVVLVLLLAEAWLAGRGSERFLRREALARGVPHAGRRRAAIALRLLTIALMVAALLQLPLPSHEPAEYRVLVSGAATDSPAAGMAEAATGQVVALGSGGAIVADIGAAPAAIPVGAGVDLGGAIRLAAAMLPADTPGRVIVAGDGRATVGTIGSAIESARAAGVPIDAAYRDPMPAGEVMVRDVVLPAPVHDGDTIAVDAIVFSTGTVNARVSFFRDGVLLAEEDVTLAPGNNRVGAALPAGERGERLFEVAVSAAGDTEPGNNRSGAVVGVRDAPAVLVVASDADWGGYLAEALAVQQLSATVIPPARAPFYMSEWLQFDVVVLMNVPAIDLTTMQQEQLARYVEVHGRGLLILGGDRAFGPGGYYQTPLERISPLSARIPQRGPQAAIAFVLDRSGSMQGVVGQGTRLDIAREATVNAIGLLHEESQVTVVVFDSEARVIVPLQERKDEAAVAMALAPISPGGGTVLLPALEAAFAELQRSTAEARHMVVMTDGLVEPADFAPLLARIREAGITVSAVAIGAEAGIALLEPIARLGGGAFHATRDFNALPSILSQEALLLSATPVVEATTPVFWVDRDAPFLSGLPATLPPLESYVATTAQPGATVHLAILDEEGETVPVLASWRHGAGQVLAFGSHGAGSGTQNWLPLAAYPLLWAQAIRQFLPGVPEPGLTVFVGRNGDEVHVTATLLDTEGRPLQGRPVVAALAGGPPVNLVEVSPGRYEASLGAAAPGTHGVVVTSNELEAAGAVHAGYQASLDFAGAAPDALMAAAAATGGAIISTETALAPGPKTWRARPGWRPWVVAALAVLLAELVLRYAPGTFAIGRAARPRSAGMVDRMKPSPRDSAAAASSS
ncbi:MAG: VWA domain-containing protein [Bauldia sp.]|nr:VWA domain-containing protein [Bauldia sp.]